MACDNCPPSSDEKSADPTPPDCHDPSDKTLSAHVLRLASKVLPEGSALLSCSCCWLPTVLDFVFAGSVTASSIQQLRPVFLAISVLTLAWSITREGFTRSNIRRGIVCAALLAWAQFNQRQMAAHVGEGHHTCH